MTLSAEIGLQLGQLDLRVSLEASAGEVVAVIGPNGAGKTTLLRCLAGLQPIDAGRVTLDGNAVDDPSGGRWVGPAERRVGMVFQDYLLFPHLTALDNVAFGVRARGGSRASSRSAALTLLTSLGLHDVVARRPQQLSGGQAQRVALARALAPSPSLLLLDEPLAALDAAVRPKIRRNLRQQLSIFDGVTVMVTHDPLDALALADRVVVLEAGAVTQAGALAEVTSRPRTRYVADLVGVTLVRGTASGQVVALDSGGALEVADSLDGPVVALIRPNSVAIHRGRPETSARNQWHCRIVGFDLLGDRVRVRLAGPVDLAAEVTTTTVAEMALAEGDDVWVSVKASEVVAYPA